MLKYLRWADLILSQDHKRSAPYREGMAYYFMRVHSQVKPSTHYMPEICGYTPGTCELDAFYAGFERGENEWRGSHGILADKDKLPY